MNTNEHMIYLRTHLKPIMEPLFVDIGKKKPDDIVAFSIDWLKRNSIDSQMVDRRNER